MDLDSDFDMSLEGETPKAKSLADCKLQTQHLKLQLEQHERDYAALLKKKQDYFYENIGWIIVLVAAYLFYNFLCWPGVSNLPTASMLLPFRYLLILVCIFLLAHVIYCSRHFFGMKDEKSGKFVTFHALIEEEQAAISNMKKLVARSEKELEETQAAADAAKEQEDALPEEERPLMRWDEQDVLAASGSSLSDTAQLIREALKEDE
jgi:hypothetical protein